MATFTNRATLSYNNSVTSSNIVTGEILEVLSVTKTAVVDTYRSSDNVTYVVSIINSGTLPYNGIVITDDLGTYGTGDPAVAVTPLSYIEDSLLYYVNGVLTATPTVSATTDSLSVSGVNVPAGGNAILVYEVSVNEFAPLGTDGSVTNTVSVSGASISTPVTATETITPESSAFLTISKALSPSTVVENGQLTYTFVIQNYGNTDAVATDNAVVRDVFSPILDPITVEFNGALWTEGVNYNYDASTGVFESIAGQITVPAATYTQDPVTGAWNVEPGVSVLRITGTV